MTTSGIAAPLSSIGKPLSFAGGHGKIALAVVDIIADGAAGGARTAIGIGKG